MTANLNTTVTTNQTQPLNCPHDIQAAKIGYTIAYCLIFVFCVAGNSFIGIIVYKTKSMRKPINFLIVNMAMSDLLYPIFVIPKRMQVLYTNFWLIDGPVGQVLCKLVPFLQDISAAVSFQSLVLIAVDRFGAVVYPLRSPLISSKLCPFFILATWIVAMTVFSPDLVAFKLVEYQGGVVCALKWNDVLGKFMSNANYFLAVYIAFLYTPWLLIATLYTIILLKLKSQKIPFELSGSARQQRVKSERNVLKMAIAIVAGFAICWLPHSILVLLHRFVWNPNTTLPCGVTLLRLITRFMAHANCALNPCICFIFSGKYRKGLKRLLNCSWKPQG